MDMKEIDLSHGDEYTCNVDLTKEELDWVYAYLQLTGDGCGVGRETLAKVCKNVEGLDEAQASCMRVVMWTASKLLGEGAQKVRVSADSWSTVHTVMDGRGEGIRADLETLGKDDVEAVAAMAKLKRACVQYSGDFTELVHLIGFMSSLDCARLFHLMRWFLDMRARDLMAWLHGGDDPCVETRPARYKSILSAEETWRGEDEYQGMVERGYYAKAEEKGDEGDYATVGRGSCKAYVTTVVSTASKENSPFKGIHQLTDEEAEKVKASFTMGPDVPDDEAVKEHLKHALNSVYGVTSAKVVHPDEDCVLPGCDRYGGNDTYLRIRKVLGHKGAFDFCMGNVVKLVDRWDKKGDPVKNLEKLRDYSAQALVEWRLYNEMLS